MKDAGKFRKILFNSPKPRNSIVLVILLGFIFGFLLSSLDILVLHSNFLLSFLLSSFFFILPALVYALLTNYFIENFYKRRAFLLSLLNQFFVFVGILLFAYFEPLLLFFLGFAFSINVLSVSGVSGRKGPVPLIYPLVYFTPLISVLHFMEIYSFTAFRSIAFFGVGVGILFSIHLVEYFFRLNVQASALKIFTSFLNEEASSLSSGSEMDALIQTLRFRTENGENVISLPELHPGPLRFMGGGSMSSSLIKSLNEDSGKEKKGYFWHAPSSHEEDPCDPDTINRIFEKSISGEPEYKEKATKILRKENDSVEIYGQRFDDIYLIFLNVRKVDDYDTFIFHNIRQNTGKKIVFVDMHHHEPVEEGGILSGDEEEAEILSREVLELLDDLEEEEEYQMKLGMEVSEDRKFMALVEEVADEKYLFLTMDRNGIPRKLGEKLSDIEKGKRFDKTIFLTTDAHQSSEFLDNREEFQLPPADLIEKASGKMEKSQVGLIEEELEDVKVLGKNSYFFEASVNFVLHLFPILLILVYFFFSLAILWELLVI